MHPLYIPSLYSTSMCTCTHKHSQASMNSEIGSLVACSHIVGSQFSIGGVVANLVACIPPLVPAEAKKGALIPCIIATGEPPSSHEDGRSLHNGASHLEVHVSV